MDIELDDNSQILTYLIRFCFDFNILFFIVHQSNFFIENWYFKFQTNPEELKIGIFQSKEANALLKKLG